MGSVQFGIPRELTLELKARHGLNHFVETGTLVGHTALWANQYFETTTTVEKDIASWQRNYDAFKVERKPIWSYCEDSGEFLQRIALKCPCLIWLDAHTNEECPVLREIAAINKSPLPHVILVDDARLFGDLPAWPTREEVVWLLINGGKRTVREVDDVLVAEPCP